MDRLSNLLPDYGGDKQKELRQKYFRARLENVRAKRPIESVFKKNAYVGDEAPPKEMLCPRCKCWTKEGEGGGKLKINGEIVDCPDCTPTDQSREIKAKVDQALAFLVQSCLIVNMWNIERSTKLSMKLFPAYADQQAKAQVQEFIRGEDKELLLSGPPGRGKSGLAKSAVFALRNQGVQVLWLTMHQYLELRRIDTSFSSDKTNIEYITGNIEALVIDDFGADSCNEKMIGDMNGMLDRRHDRGLRTLITSNHNMTNLSEYLTLDNFRGVQPAERLISRLKGWYAKYEIPASYPEMR